QGQMMLHFALWIMCFAAGNQIEPATPKVEPKDPVLRIELLKRMERDQELRRKFIAMPKDQAVQEQMGKPDREHSKWLSEQIDEANVDQRRASMGLSSLAEYQLELERVYKPKPAKEASQP